MRKVSFLCVVFVSCAAAFFDRKIERFDFANYEYPWRESDSWPHDLEWLSTAEPNQIQLVNGRWKAPDDNEDHLELPFSGLTLDEVLYGDVTSDSRDEAIVILRFDSGGTQYHYWAYIYAADADRPRLLACFRAGDRAAQGLYRMYVRDRKLVVELYDPEKRQGDCCSTGYLRFRYRWDGHAFVTVGGIERGSAKSESRRRVSTFGMPYDQMRK